MTTQPHAPPQQRPLVLWIALGALGFLLVGAIVTVAALTLFLVPARVERSEVSGPEPALVQAATPAEFAERNGIEVLMLGVTAGGGLIDMRLRVLDAEKAALLLDEAHRPLLIAEDDGAVLTRHVRPEYKSVQDGRIYYLLYSNTRNAIGPGDLVSVEMNGLRLEHLPAR